MFFLWFFVVPAVVWGSISLIGVVSAYYFTGGNLSRWFWLYMAVPVVVLGAGVNTRYLHGSIAFAIVSAISSFGAVPLAVWGGVNASDRPRGPVFHSLVIVGIEAVTLFVMSTFQGIGAC